MEAASSYQAGLKFGEEAAAARAQNERHWQVKANVRLSGSEALFDIDARDAAGHPITGLTATASLHHPANARGDRPVTLSEETAGPFPRATPAAAGQWDLVVELSRDGERVFRSRSRLVLQ